MLHTSRYVYDCFSPLGQINCVFADFTFLNCKSSNFKYFEVYIPTRHKASLKSVCNNNIY